MILTKENPQPLQRRMRGLPHNHQFNIYTASQKTAQARIARRYNISLSHAVVIADLLNMGGANNG